MRLLIKLSVAVAIAASVQLAIGRQAGEMLDELAFIVRVHAVTQRGEPINSPELLDVAQRLWERKNCVRAERFPDFAPVAATEASADAAWPLSDCDAVSDDDLDSPPGHL